MNDDWFSILFPLFIRSVSQTTKKRKRLTNESFIQQKEEYQKIKNGSNRVNKQSMKEEKKERKEDKKNKENGY